MENLSELNAEDKKIVLGSNEIYQLTQTRKWTMFLSISGLIFIGLVIAVILVGILSKLNSSANSLITFLPLVIVVLIYFFPIYYLFQFSRYSKMAITSMKENVLSIALKYLKMHFRFMAIFIMIALLIYIIVGASIIITGEISKFLY
jgi:hypothetical protein